MQRCHGFVKVSSEGTGRCRSQRPIQRKDATPGVRALPPGEIDMIGFNLSQYGLSVEDVRRNLAPPQLYAEAIREEPDCVISDTGALIAYSGAKTGRSPKDKRVVRQPKSEKD